MGYGQRRSVSPWYAAGAAARNYLGYRAMRSYRNRRRRRSSYGRPGRSLGYPTRGRRFPIRTTVPESGGAFLNRANNRNPRISSGALQRILQTESSIVKEIQQSGTGLKPYHYCKQMFAETLGLGDASAAPFATKCLLNSTFEPVEGVSTHQPLGRDLLATIYNDYVVLGCKWTCMFRNVSEPTFSRVWVHMDTSSTSKVTTFQEAMERPDVQVAHICGSGENKDNEHITLTGFCKPQMYLLATGGSFNEQYTAGVGANPSSLIRLHIQADDYTGAAIGTNGIEVDVQLQYYVVYRTPIGTTES